jgi:nucleoside-diphosphate-sugar epimerase
VAHLAKLPEFGNALGDDFCFPRKIPMPPVDPTDIDQQGQDEPSSKPGSEPPIVLPIELRVLDQSDVDEDDEFDDEDMDEGPRTILITGANGNLAQKLRIAFADIYELVLIDKVAPPGDEDIIIADLSEWDETWVSCFENVDTVIHLAANPNEFSPWDDLVGPNMDVLANVFNAAAYGGVERVIFASSNHAMGDYQEFGDMPITVNLPAKPDSPYGGTKLFGERLGKSLASAFDITFIALRLGWIQSGENRPDTLPHEWARLMWLSNDDLAHLFECAIEADLGETNFLVVNGMSNNQGMRWDLTEASEWLGYEPTGDSSEGLS